MLIPEFALRESEKSILAPKLNRTLNITLNQQVRAYLVEDSVFNEICNFVGQFNEGGEIHEDKVNPPTRSGDRSNVLRAVSTIFNVMVDVQKIKDQDLKTAANASLLSAIMGVYVLSPDYGNRLISIIKSKI